jgi:hypothetical protein
MQEIPKLSEPKDMLLMVLGSILGGNITLLIIKALPLSQATLASAIMLASLIVTCASIATPVFWWMGVGAIAGIIIGLGGDMSGTLAENKTPIDLNLRLTLVAFQGAAGLLSGIVLGRRIHQPHLPTLKEFISSLSALTVGIFAVVVTIRFVMEGLEPARTLSSRLSATTTILITLLAIPGALGYLLAEHFTQAKRR